MLISSHLSKPALGIGLDRFGRAFGLAHAAVDTFVRMDDEHVLALIEAVDGANFDAVGVFALNAVVGDDIGHLAGGPERNVSDWRRAPGACWDRC